MVWEPLGPRDSYNLRPKQPPRRADNPHPSTQQVGARTGTPTQRLNPNIGNAGSRFLASVSCCRLPKIKKPLPHPPPTPLPGREPTASPIPEC